MTGWTLGASLLLFVGLCLVGQRCRWGFLLSVVGESVWVIASARRGMYDLSALCVAFAALAAFNFRQWSRSS